MKAVILAGGVRSGQELGGAQWPRALWPFPSEPLIATVARYLQQAHAEAIAICANGKTQMISAELSAGAEPWRNLHYSEDRFPRGPAGCVKDLEAWLGGDPFVVIQGTAHYDFDLADMLAEHRRSQAAITVGARTAPPRRGERPLEPAGVYVMSPEVLPFINPVGYQDIKEQLLPRIIAAGRRVHCHRIRGHVRLIHGCDHYLTALADILMSRRWDPGMEVVQRHVWKHPTAKIAGSARLIGPVWIDREVDIAGDALVVGPALLGPQVRVEAGAIISRAAAFSGSHILERARLADSIVPPHARHEAMAQQEHWEAVSRGRAEALLR